MCVQRRDCACVRVRVRAGFARAIHSLLARACPLRTHLRLRCDACSRGMRKLTRLRHLSSAPVGGALGLGKRSRARAQLIGGAVAVGRCVGALHERGWLAAVRGARTDRLQRGDLCRARASEGARLAMVRGWVCAWFGGHVQRWKRSRAKSMSSKRDQQG